MANAFPLLVGNQFHALVLDIGADGLREPITLHPDGSILDGRNRYRACLQAKVEPKFVEWDGQGSEQAFVISKNLMRRHLTAGQRAMVAAKFADFGHGGDRSKGPAGTLKISEAAAALNVGERSVKRAKSIRKYGGEELVEAVETGAMSVTAAALEAKPPADKKQHQDAGQVIVGGPAYYDLCRAWSACSEDEQGRFLIHISWDVVEELKKERDDLKKALAKQFPPKPLAKS